MVMPEAVKALGNTLDFARELIAAEFRDPVIESVTHAYQLDVKSLDNPDTLFGVSPDWTSLTDTEKATVIAHVREMAGDNPVLPIPSTALIAVAQR
ncbi:MULTISPECIES: hypothetical protein [unclassified Pseudomonas]|uniref:hypothetical protein n=1 Tax=unclassified Pseudomonas TaxID=196821 RepID=UPI0038500151